MGRWAEFEADEPDLARWAPRLLAGNDGVAFLATVREDGTPQVRPIMPVLSDGRLWALIVSLSSKHRDLVRNGRYALHLVPGGQENVELHIQGRAVLVDNSEVRAAVLASAGREGHDFESLFELGVGRVQVTRWANWGTAKAWPEFVRWSSGE